MREGKSKLEIYSLGIVAKDKVRGSDIITVYPVETLPLVNGNVLSFNKQYSANLPNLSGTQNQGQLKSSAILQATWLALECGNQNTAPDVYANEGVVLWRYAEVETYFWQSLFREPTIRRLEQVLYIYGGTKEHGVELSRTNSYWMEVNKFEGNVKLHTSTSNKEKIGYDIGLDGLNGVMTINDNKGNTIVLSSADDDLTITTNKTINLKTGKEINITAGNDINLTAPNIGLKGNVTINGNTVNNGTLNSTGNITSNGVVTGDTGVYDAGDSKGL